MTRKQPRVLAVLYLLALAGCSGGAPVKVDTPAQVMVGLRAAEIATVKTFNAYSAQPFCGAPTAPNPPLCADRSVVIEGAVIIREVDTAMDNADKVIAAAGISDSSWAAIADVRKYLDRLKTFVGLATGKAQ